jgi:hypothetical protein
MKRHRDLVILAILVTLLAIALNSLDKTLSPTIKGKSSIMVSQSI